MNKELNTIPINLQAAKMLWKSPWWAKAPPEEKRKIQQALSPLTITSIIDYTKSPPIRMDDKPENQPKNWIGTKIQWNSNGDLGRIIGFANVVESIQKTQNKLRVRREFFWWAVKETGEFVRITSKNDGRGKKWTPL